MAGQITVKYKGPDMVATVKNKTYEVISVEKGYYRIITEINEELSISTQSVRDCEIWGSGECPSFNIKYKYIGGNIMESYYDGIPPEIKKMSLEEIEAEIERIKNEENELAENEEKNSPLLRKPNNKT